MSRTKLTVYLTFLLILQTCPAFASRFWLTNVKEMPPKVIKEQLLKSSKGVDDGWSLAFYKGSITLIARSEESARKDKRFEQAIGFAAENNAKLLVSHWGHDEAGCPDKAGEPVQRFYAGKSWLFSNNGGLNSEMLMPLIGDEFLRMNPPATCGSEGSDGWLASDVLLLYLLKHIEQAGSIEQGLQAALAQISSRNPEALTDLNFYLADGQDLWLFRGGAAIYYTYLQKEQMSIITSDVPGSPKKWKQIPDGNLAIVRPNEEPQFYALSQ